MPPSFSSQLKYQASGPLGTEEAPDQPQQFETQFLSELSGNFQMEWTWMLRQTYLVRRAKGWSRPVISRLLDFTDQYNF